MEHPSLLIYGATGYTGSLLARTAAARGLRPILGARNEPRLKQLAQSLDLEYRVAVLEDGLEEALRGVRVVLHAAGPFCATFRPMVEACLNQGVHYLDVSGELPTFEATRQYDAPARARRVMVMPGVGFDVVPSDCLALYVAGRVREPRRLAIAMTGLELMSRGSLRTLLAQAATQDVYVRRGGILVPVPPGSIQRSFDFGTGPRRGIALNWPDLVTAYLSTGIPDIEVYFEAHPMLELSLTAKGWLGGLLQVPAGRAWMERVASTFPEGPSEAQRAGRRALIVAEVENGAGHRVRARLRTPEAYGFTCTTALAIAERVLAGDLEPGLQTPARVYGPDFVLSFEGVSREDF